jgi:hypothetical protein
VHSRGRHRPGRSRSPPAQLDHEGITAEVLESVRKDGVLTVRVRFRNTTDKPIKFKLVHAGRYDANYISAGDTKYTIIATRRRTSSPRHRRRRMDRADDQGEGHFGWWAKIPAPPPERKTYTLYLSVGPPIEDVPIVDKP